MPTDAPVSNPTPDPAPVLALIDATLAAGETTMELWRRLIDDAAEVYASATSMWLRPLAAMGLTPNPSGFHSYPDGKTIDEIAVGDSATITRRVSQSDIDAFARISGDDNPAHVDAIWAEQSPFKGRLAHGILTAGLVSAALGTELPGPGAIYLSQTLKWVAPVRPGDVLTATVTVTEVIADKGRVVLETVVSKGDTVVLTGEALVMPRRVG